MCKTLGCLILLLLVGCANFGDITKDFKAANPELSTIMVDEDNDGLADTAIVTKNGQMLIDPETGAPMEIPEVRAALDAAKATDNIVGLEIESWASLLVLLGVPGAGIGTLIGRKWGKIKPTQRATLLWSSLKEFIGSIEIARNGGTVEQKAEMTEKFGAISKQARDLLVDLKGELKKEEQAG
ncbi:hypothetical protein LCGC14_0297620 [marine sediment metagenome]|uniref:Uncharacterized protein n=1 Tax=marine sediment metagenome TaxID=412755 RepID=A0A0F9TW20_9ZZZZ